MKKVSKCLVLVLALCLLAVPVLAAAGAVQATLYYRDISIRLDGEKLDPKDANGASTEPFIYNDSTYLPVRAISEALGMDVQWDETTNTVTLVSEDRLLYKFLTPITHDIIITDAVNDKYFKEGSAMEGVEALLNSGSVYVNGFQVPATEEACGEKFVIMGYDKLYKAGDDWKAENNIRVGTSFDDARLGMVEALSRTTGLPVYLYDNDGDGYTDKIDIWFYAVALVDSLIDNGDGTVRIDRGDFQLTKSKLDVNDITFPKENVDPSIQEGDFAMFWENARTGWHLQEEQAVIGRLTDAADHQYYEFNSVHLKDGASNPKAFINVGNRPGQFANAHLAFGLGDLDIVYWKTTEGDVPSGFTRGAKSVEALERAIAYCEDVKAKVTVSADGSDVAAGSDWATAETVATYDAAIAQAKAVLANNAAKDSARDTEIYNLYSATWGANSKIENILKGEKAVGGFLAAVQTKA